MILDNLLIQSSALQVHYIVLDFPCVICKIPFTLKQNIKHRDIQQGMSVQQ